MKKKILKIDDHIDGRESLLIICNYAGIHDTKLMKK
jgi:hypothetical protein